MGEMEDRGYQRMSHAGCLYAFHKDAGDVPWVNLRWLRDVVEQVEADGNFLRDIASKPEQLRVVRQAVQAVDDSRQRRE